MPGEGKGFEWVPLCRDRMLALVPPGHPLAAGTAVRLEDLAAEEFIMPMPDYDGEVRFILDKLERWPHILFSACSDYAIINMVTEGLGISTPWPCPWTRPRSGCWGWACPRSRRRPR